MFEYTADWWHCEACGHDNMTTHIVRNRQAVTVPPSKYCTKCGTDRPPQGRRLPDGKLILCEKCNPAATFVDRCPEHGPREDGKCFWPSTRA